MIARKIVAAILLMTGITVAAVATVVPRLLPTEWFWTEEQSAEQAMAASRLHQITHRAANVEFSKSSSQTDKQLARQELVAAEERYEASRSKLKEAQFWRHTLPKLARWAAGGICVFGVMVYLSTLGAKD